MIATQVESLRSRAAGARRVVVKIGSAVLADAAGRFAADRFSALCADIAEAAREREVVIVSSGAIALGVRELSLPSRPVSLPGKQAAAAVGQCLLMQLYGAELSRRGRRAGQVLLTHDDVADRRRYLNARQTLQALVANGVVPVVNENDTVAVEEIQFGDNDALAGLVAGLWDAELLVLLSDVDGLYDRDPAVPGARRITEVALVTEEIEALAGNSRSGVGTGGMIAKVRAARRAAESGTLSIVAAGRTPGVLPALLRGEEIGTLFGAPREALRARQRWIAHALEARGRLHVDAGAREAIVTRGGSLLASGLRRVEGAFGRGEAVEIAGEDGRPFARGLAGYGSEELARLCGARSAEIEARLGYKYLDEVVHRDDLVLLAVG